MDMWSHYVHYFFECGCHLSIRSPYNIPSGGWDPHVTDGRSPDGVPTKSHRNDITGIMYCHTHFVGTVSL